MSYQRKLRQCPNHYALKPFVRGTETTNRSKFLEVSVSSLNVSVASLSNAMTALIMSGCILDVASRPVNERNIVKANKM